MSRKQPILPLKEIFRALDNKDYWFYEWIGKEKQKAFSSYLQLKYNASAVGTWIPNIRPAKIKPIKDVQEYHTRITNTELNINFWEISKHPKLVWLILCAINSGSGNYARKYLPMKKNIKDNKKTKFLRELYPTWKLSDIEAYANMCDKKELKQLAIEHGYDDKSIREKL